jgi:glucosamine-6-phosphate deaminase
LAAVNDFFPPYLSLAASELGKGQPVKVRILADAASLAQDFAQTILDEIETAQREGRASTFIVPVGPVDQYPILARLINARKISCREVVFINMDEYLDEHDQPVPEAHPLSFRGHMNRAFYNLLETSLAPAPQNRIFPDPNNLGTIEKAIESRGGVDVCFGGIGINGHVAFNEPPEAGENISVKEFAALPTRVVTLARETRTINSVTVGGEISIVPRRAVTVGMREILASRRLRFYCNRPWQSAVVRRVLHGPLTPDCPASFLRTHADAMLAMTEQVATPPQIQLR